MSVSRERHSSVAHLVDCTKSSERSRTSMSGCHEEHKKIGQRNVHRFTKRVWSVTFNTVLTAKAPDAAPRQAKAAHKP